MADLIIWTDKYSVGCNYIDQQHKKLIDIINELHSAFMSRESNEKLSKILSELVDYTKYHFTAEEEMLKKHGFGPSENHKKQHQEFVEKIEIFKKRHELGDSIVGFDMLNFLKDWLLNHILKTDMSYKEPVCSKVD